MYGTFCSIFTNQGRNFESFEFLEFCTFFRIHKLQTTSYHPQSNGVVEGFNQTLKLNLRKTLDESQIFSWDIYLNFIVFSYNLSIHSSTGFIPFYLTFASEARLHSDLIFGTFSALLNGDSSPSKGPLTLLFKSFAILSHSYDSVRENLHSVHKRE